MIVHCLHCEAPIAPGRSFCDAECKTAHDAAWKRAQAAAAMREEEERREASRKAAAIPKANAPAVSQSTVEDTIDDAMSMVGKMAGGLFDFLVSPSTADFVDRFDKKHGTQLGQQIETNAPGALEAFDGVARTAPAVAASAPTGETRVGSESVQSTRASSTRADCTQSEPNVLLEDDRIVVVAIEEPPHPCAFCRGRVVFGANATTGAKIAIACPKCNASPKVASRLVG
jgi:hypothetical protein